MAIPHVTSVYDDLLSYLIDKATPEEILAYTIPSAVADRAVELMEKNNEGTLTAEEVVELDEMRQVDKLIGLLKARSLDKLSSS